MTFKEAVRVYAECASRDTVRDRAIVRTVHAELGVVVSGVLIGMGAVEEAGEEPPVYSAMGAIVDLFTKAVEDATAPVEKPKGAVEVPGPQPGTYLRFGENGERLLAEIRDDGHTYIGDERID